MKSIEPKGSNPDGSKRERDSGIQGKPHSFISYKREYLIMLIHTYKGGFPAIR
ncbi:MAG: hypothetical protein KGI06_04570 [Candidatus Micrarchaeota archaeon]|nr:hypothetical protein [Candidatus Micrarchaeota archaeon]